MRTLPGVGLACALALFVSGIGRAGEDDLFQECCHHHCGTVSGYGPCCAPPACACPSVSFRIGTRCGPIRRLLGRCCLLPCTSCYSPPVPALCPSCAPPPVSYPPAVLPPAATLPDPSATHNYAPVNPDPRLTPVPPTSITRPVPPPLTPPLPPPPVRLEHLVSFPGR
jgi:hypothetical protein